MPIVQQIPVLQQAQSQADWIRRQPLDTANGEIAPALAKLLEYWRQERDAALRLPGHRAIDPLVLHRYGLVGFTHVVDATPDDPLGFVFRLFGGRVTLDNGRNFMGTTIGDYPVKAYRDAVASDYLTAKMGGAPRLQRIRATLNYSRRAYQRLILPFSRPDGKPDRLLVAVSYEPFQLASELVEDLGARNPR